MKITSRGQVLLVHLQMTFLSVYFPSLFQTFMTDFLLWNTKEDILKNVGNQMVLCSIDLDNMTKKYYGGQWDPKWFGSEYQNILFCVLQKTET